MRLSHTFFAAILFLIGAGAASADTEDNTLGFYFDVAAEANCLETPAYVTVPLHLVLTSPTMSGIQGYEFGYTGTGSFLVTATELMGSGPIDVGGSAGNHIVGLATPLTPGATTVLVTLSVFVMDDRQISFELHGADPASIPEYPLLPVLLDDGGELFNVALSTGPGQPSARINGKCDPDIDENSWDGVKSLYQ